MPESQKEVSRRQVRAYGKEVKVEAVDVVAPHMMPPHHHAAAHAHSRAHPGHHAAGLQNVLFSGGVPEAVGGFFRHLAAADFIAVGVGDKDFRAVVARFVGKPAHEHLAAAPVVDADCVIHGALCGSSTFNVAEIARHLLVVFTGNPDKKPENEERCPKPGEKLQKNAAGPQKLSRFETHGLSLSGPRAALFYAAPSGVACTTS